MKQSWASIGKRAAWGVVALLALALAHGAAWASDAPMRQQKSKLAFVRDGNIWTANGDGSGQRLVVRSGTHPCWSPDKSRIAFVRDGNIWVAGADGAHQRQLTRRWSAHAESDEVGWQPGGTAPLTWNRKYGQITFSHPERFYVVQEGSKEGTMVDAMSIYDLWPDLRKADYWTGAYPGTFDAQQDSTESANLNARFSLTTADSPFLFSEYSCPAWDPTGEYLAYSRNGDLWIAKNVKEGSPVPQVFLWDAKRAAALASFDAANWHSDTETVVLSRISWSPDGKALLCSLNSRANSGTGMLRKVTLKTSPHGMPAVAKDNLIANDCYDACFSPDGKSIACLTMGADGIYLMSRDGSERRLLTEHAEEPAW